MPVEKANPSQQCSDEVVQYPAGSGPQGEAVSLNPAVAASFEALVSPRVWTP